MKFLSFLSYSRRYLFSFFYKSVIVRECILVESVVYQNSYFHLSLKASGCRHILIQGEKYPPLELIALQAKKDRVIKIEFIGAYSRVEKYLEIPLFYCKPSIEFPNLKMEKAEIRRKLIPSIVFPEILVQNKRILLMKFYKSNFGKKSKASQTLNSKTLIFKNDIYEDLYQKLEN